MGFQLSKEQLKDKNYLIGFCFNQTSIAILSMIEYEAKHYTVIMERIGFAGKKSSGMFAYYMKRLKALGTIIENKNDEYILTEKGKIILKTFYSLSEKFISNNKEELCQNSNGDYEHKFIRLCKNCAFIDYGETNGLA